MICGLALLVVACGDGTSVATTVAELAEESTTTTAVTTTTTTSSTSTTSTSTTTSTTIPPTTSTTESPPKFPPSRESLEHGGDTWAVVLAASTDINDPQLASAALDAEAAGHRTGPTDCDAGVAEALGLPETEHYYSVSVYLETEADANQARAAFLATGWDATVALLQTYCLD